MTLPLLIAACALALAAGGSGWWARRRRRGATAAAAPALNAPVEPPLVTRLRVALADDLLYNRYQPKVRMRSNEIDSLEALVRWRHATEGDVPPDRFIEAAERSGLIRPLTEGVIRRALADRATLKAAGHDLLVWVNVSAPLLTDRAFTEWVVAAVASERIGLEITETAMIHNPEAALANLRTFAAAGIRLAIDDYGSGFSSLAYLKQIPAGELKIDRLFISGLATSHRDPLLVRSTIDLAHALEMEVTAEGIETLAEFALLRIMGCDIGQGFLIAAPLALPELTTFLAGYANNEASFANAGEVRGNPFRLGR